MLVMLAAAQAFGAPPMVWPEAYRPLLDKWVGYLVEPTGRTPASSCVPTTSPGIWPIT